MKSPKNNLCMALALALTLSPVLGVAAAAADTTTSLPKGIYSNSVDTPNQSGGTITYPGESAYGATGEADGAAKPAPRPELEYDAQPGGSEAATSYSVDLAQFIPSADYGLFGVKDNRLVNLNGATLTMGKAYTLALRLLIDRPVASNEVYSYWLPAALMGRNEAQERTFSDGGALIATAHLNGNEVRVVFSEQAAKATQGGRTYELRYDFKAQLNALEVGDDSGCHLNLAMANGAEAIDILIAHPQAESQPAEPAPSVEPEPVDGDAEAIEPEAPAIEGEPGEGKGTDMEAGEASERAEPSATDREVTVERILPRFIRNGSIFKMQATLIGFDDADYAIEWQYDAGQGWQAYGATGSTIDVVVDDNSLDYDWRAMVAIKLHAPEDHAPAQTEGTDGIEAQPADAAETIE